MLVLVASAAIVALVVGTLFLLSLRRGDEHFGDRVTEVLTTPSRSPRTFTLAMVADLPDPAQRYFTYAIEMGAPLRFVADIELSGQLGLGTKDKPNYLPMRGSQILRLDGFVWHVKAGSPAIWFSGSDGYLNGEGWTRFWLYNLIPIVRAGGDENIARSAAGRAVAESLFWVPAALLPSEQVSWQPVDADTARAIVTLDGYEHRVDLTVAADGRPKSVVIMRWSRENPEKVWQLQPFGGSVRAMKEVDGYRVAVAVDGGNWFGTPDYFPFYRARITRIRLS